MPHRRHNIFSLLTVFLMITASLIFFLPAAVSMNTQAPTVASEKFSTIGNALGPLGLTIPLNASAAAGIIADLKPGLQQFAAKDAVPSTDAAVVPAATNKKGSLSLKTAAIVGSSAAVAAAVLARGARLNPKN